MLTRLIIKMGNIGGGRIGKAPAARREKVSGPAWIGHSKLEVPMDVWLEMSTGRWPGCLQRQF